MNYIVYRTENKLNGRFYYGVHKDNDRKYLGSGKLLKQATEKYGEDNFVRRTIMPFKTSDEAYSFEALVVDEQMINNPDCYNIKLGGNGGWEHIDKSGKPNPSAVESNKSRAYRVEIDGKEYNSTLEACEELGIKYITAIYRLKAETFPNYKRL